MNGAGGSDSTGTRGMHRRGLLGGAALALLARGAASTAAEPDAIVAPLPAAAGADAELLALIAEFWREQAAIEAWNAGKMTWEEGERHNAIWWACCRAMTGITPATEAGRRAKAAVALVALEKVADPSSDVEVLARTVLAEIGGRPQSTPAPDPDAELIAACERIVHIMQEQKRICIADELAPDEGPNHVRYEALWGEYRRIVPRLYELPEPVTQAGLQAAARAVLVTADRERNGDLIANDAGMSLLLSLALFHAGPEFEAEQVRLTRADNGLEALT